MADKQGSGAVASKRRYYLKNKASYYLRNKLKRLKMSKHAQKVKSVPCMDCKKRYPFYVMDFDHRNPANKIDNIGRIIRTNSWTKLYEEISKCDVVCSNCHRKRTFNKWKKTKKKTAPIVK